MLDLAQVNFDKGNGLVVVVAQDDRSGAVLMVAFADREALERTLATGEMHYRSRSRGLWHKGATSGNVQRVVSLALDCDGDTVLARVAPAGPACHTGAVSCFGTGALAAETLGMLDATIARRAREARRIGEGKPAVGRIGAPAESSSGGGAGEADRAGSRVSSARGAPPHAQHGAPTAGDHHRIGAADTVPPHSAALTSADPPTADPSPARPSYTARLLADRNLRLKKLGEEVAELVLACADEDPARAAEEGADIVYHTLVALRAVGVGLDDVRRVLAARAAPPTR